MYKVLIIDDEETVRRGIRSLIDWEKIGFQICDEGKDGKDGLNKILQHKPELVLVDIKMPGLSGIEVIRNAREQNFTGEFIILTGYSEFEYAHSAITYGVKEYLLKPIDEKELEKIVEEIQLNLKQKEGLYTYHKKNEEKAREELLRQILLNYETKESLEVRVYLHHLDITSNHMCVAIVQDTNVLQEEASDLFISKVEELLIGANTFMDKVLMDEKMVLIYWGFDCKKIAEILYKGNERIKSRYGKGLLIAVGHNVTKWYNLCYSYELAKFLLEKEFLYSKQNVLSFDILQKQYHRNEAISLEKLIMMVEVGDLEGMKEGILLFHNYCREFMMDESEIKAYVMYNLMLLKDKLVEKYSLEIKDAKEATEMIKGMIKIKKLDELLDAYYVIMQHLSNLICGSDTIINRVYHYIEKNYNQNLKLDTIAKMYNYNSAYLGQIFYKKLGQSFNHTLDSIRINHGKQLLMKSDYKVYQIAEMIGYSNLDVFYLKFKKHVGISPKEFKKNSEVSTSIIHNN